MSEQADPCLKHASVKSVLHKVNHNTADEVLLMSGPSPCLEDKVKKQI